MMRRQIQFKLDYDFSFLLHLIIQLFAAGRCRIRSCYLRSMGSAPSTLSDDEEESFPSTSTTARRSSSSSSFTEDFKVVWIEGHEADAHVRLFARVDEIVDQAIEMARCTGQAGREAKRRTRLLGMLCTLVFGEQPYAPSLRVLRRTMVRNPTEQFALFRLDARTDGTLAFFQKPRDLAELATVLVSVGETVADPLVRQHCVHLMIAFIQTEYVRQHTKNVSSFVL